MMWHKCHTYIDRMVDKGLRMLLGDDPMGCEMDNYYQ